MSDRVLALADGRVIALGTPAEVRSHPSVVDAWAGHGDAGRGFGDGAMSGGALLRVRNLESFYGPIVALRGVSLDVPQRCIVAVLGANGAGKTTLLRPNSGVMDPEKGEVLLRRWRVVRFHRCRVRRRSAGRRRGYFL